METIVLWVGINIVLSVINLYYFSKYNRNKNNIKKITELHKQQVLKYVNIISNYKKEIQLLYKTIDEFTNNKENLICEEEVCEKSLRKEKKKK